MVSSTTYIEIPRNNLAMKDQEVRHKQYLTDIRETFNERVTQTFILSEEQTEEFLQECKGSMRVLYQAFNNTKNALQRRAKSNVIFKTHEILDTLRSECRNELMRAEQSPRPVKEQRHRVASIVSPLTPDTFLEKK